MAPRNVRIREGFRLGLAHLGYAAIAFVFLLPLWWAVAHLFNHQTHHRGQLTTLFTQQGHDPGSTDLFAMLRELDKTATKIAVSPIPTHGIGEAINDRLRRAAAPR